MHLPCLMNIKEARVAQHPCETSCRLSETAGLPGMVHLREILLIQHSEHMQYKHKNEVHTAAVILSAALARAPLLFCLRLRSIRPSAKCSKNLVCM